MTNKKLGDLHEDILNLIHQYSLDNVGRAPGRSNKYFIDELEKRRGITYKTNRISNVKSELKRDGYIGDDYSLTDKGRVYLGLPPDSSLVRGSVVRLLGTVQAGPTVADIHVEYSALGEVSGETETILLPNVPNNKRICAFEVEGESMVEMGIFSGDYILVELKESTWWPDQGDTIIATYVPHQPARSEEDEPSDSEYVGPVVKVYKERFGEKGCQLGWQKFNARNPYLIRADALKPMGKVIGVYRDYQHLNRASM